MTDYEKIAAMIEQKARADGCNGCAYADRQEWEMPCKDCKRAAKDYWRPRAHESEVEP